MSVQEDGAEQPDFPDGVDVIVDLDPVTDIVGVLDEKEDDTGQDLGETSTDKPAQAC